MAFNAINAEHITVLNTDSSVDVAFIKISQNTFSCCRTQLLHVVMYVELVPVVDSLSLHVSHLHVVAAADFFLLFTYDCGHGMAFSHAFWPLMAVDITLSALHTIYTNLSTCMVAWWQNR